MPAHNPVSVSTGPGSHHGRSASDQPIPSAVRNSPNSCHYIDNEGPSTHPRRTKQPKFFSHVPVSRANHSFTAGLPNNVSHPSLQVKQACNASLPYHPNSQCPEAKPVHNTCTLFTNDTAVQAHTAGLHYNTTILTRRKHWYFLIQITVPPPSIMNVRHNMSSRQRAKARLHQLTVNKRSINGQRAFIRGSIEKMEARLEVLEVEMLSQSDYAGVLILAFRLSIRTRLTPIRSCRNCMLWRLLWTKPMTI